MLALVHHLVVSERVPLPGIFELAANLTNSWTIVEYVDPADSQFQRISRGRDSLHRDLTRQSFEYAASERFEIVESLEVTPTRCLYLLGKNI